MRGLRKERNVGGGGDGGGEGGRTVVRKKERVRLLPFLYCSAKVTSSRRGTKEARPREGEFVPALAPSTLVLSVEILAQ